MTFLKLTTFVALIFFGFKYIYSEYIIYKDTNITLHHRRHHGKLVAYNLLYASIVMASFAAPFVAGAFQRWFLVLYFSLSAIAVVIYRNITGYYVHQRAYFDEDVHEILWREMSMAFEAIRTYYREILSALIPGIVVVTIFLWEPSATFRISGWLPLAALAGIVVVYSRGWLVFAKGWPIAFPSIATVPPKIALQLLNNDFVSPKALNEVTLPLSRRSLNKVVFIMDESVRGDYLTLGNPTLDTTPYLSQFGPMLVNFGVAISGHNCSSYSRYILRYGARIEELPKQLFAGLNLAGPNIWQYAKAAGFKTVYLDGFSGLLRLHSGMSLQEASLIDRYVTIPKMVPHEFDACVAERLVEALADPAPAFIYVDKYGVHAPYDDKFPPDCMIYRAPEGASRRELLITAYKNAIRWNVDAFFQRFLDKVDLATTALIYTSDHGQSLLDGGYSLCHCSTGPEIADGEALVPLFAVVGEQGLRSALAKASRRLKDRASHFEIFPTLLITFGYRPDAVESRYGTGLFGLPNDWRKFLSGFKESARWVTVSKSADSQGR